VAKRYALTIPLRLDKKDAQALRDLAARHSVSLSGCIRQLIRQTSADPQAVTAVQQEDPAKLLAAACDPANPNPKGSLLRATGAFMARNWKDLSLKDLDRLIDLILELSGDDGLSKPAPRSYESRLLDTR
jgi:hypothetical protein